MVSMGAGIGGAAITGDGGFTSGTVAGGAFGFASGGSEVGW